MQRGMYALNLGVGAIAFVVLAGCSGSGPVSPALHSSAPLFPQPIPAFTVSGVVSLANSGQVVPLEGVHGKDGSYTIRDVGSPAGSFFFSKDGYRSLSRQFQLMGDTRLDIQLVRE